MATKKTPAGYGQAHQAERDRHLAGYHSEPCTECGGTECGTPRIPVCCTECTH